MIIADIEYIQEENRRLANAAILSIPDKKNEHCRGESVTAVRGSTSNCNLKDISTTTVLFSIINNDAE